MSSRAVPMVMPLALLVVAGPALLKLLDRDRPSDAARPAVATAAPAAGALATTAPVTTAPAVVSAVTTPATAASAVPTSAAAPATSLTTAASTAAPSAGSAVRTRFRVAADLTAGAGPASAWRLAPAADAPARLGRVLATLAPGATLDGRLAPVGLPAGATFAAAASGATWRFAAATVTPPIPERCIGLDLSDPRTFPRCEAAMAEAKVAWRGGSAAPARAAALWASMGYDAAGFTAPAGPDASGYVTARVVLGGQAGPFMLRVRFQGDAVESADGVLAAPVAVADERTAPGVPLAELQMAGAVEVRTSDGSVVDPTDAPADATIVGAEPALVAVAAPAGDANLYAVPGYAFVAADGHRYLRPAALVPPWLLTAG